MFMVKKQDLYEASVKCIEGVDEFLDYAFVKASQDNKFLCPCKNFNIYS